MSAPMRVRAAESECGAQKGPAPCGRPLAGDSSGLRGSAAPASSGEIGDQPFESPGPVPGAHGKEGFDRTVGRVVVAANVHRLGQILKQQEARRRQWH